MAGDSPSGITVAGPGQQQQLAAIDCRHVTPQVSDDWLPTLLEKLLPYAAASVHRFAAELYGDQVLQNCRYPLSFPFEELATHGIDPLYAADQDQSGGL